MLKRPSPGEHRTACPECAQVKRRPNDDALAVRIDDRGAAWICHRCGWTGALNQRQETSRPYHIAAPAAPDPAIERKRELAPWAQRLWRECRPIEPGTPAHRYLEVRGCAVPDADADLRWHPAMKNRRCAHVGPALVGLITDIITAEPINLHRTWLGADGSGKAPIERPRLYLFNHDKAGGVVRLVDDAEVTLGLVIGEGIETCLSAMRAFRPAWACLDAGNVEAFPVLPGIESLTILTDHDESGAGQKAARTCATRWLTAEIEARIWIGANQGTDFNDFARGNAA